MTLASHRTVDPRISLTLSIQAQPGVYALLLGSGTSTGAGVPTGWGVIKSLVRRAAAAAGDTLPEDASDEQMEAWWAKNGDGRELGYSGVLETLGLLPAARSALLRDYFEPSEDDRQKGLKIPGASHRAIANLVVRGSIRVILTTNFDSLIEQALDEVSVRYQVLTNYSQIEAREPLHHANCTVVKLHGDYRSLDQKNTLAELSSYAPAAMELLHEISESYGLVINGWSADWDVALVDAIKGRRDRRYPLYWSSLTKLRPKAQTIATQHRAGVIEGVTADDFFSDLLHRLEALDALSVEPLSEEMSIARLKKLVPHRDSYVELREMLEYELEPLELAIRRGDLIDPKNSIEMTCRVLRDSAKVLVRLVATGVMLDHERIHQELWIWVMERLLKVRPETSQGRYALHRYPALLLLRAIAMIAVTYEREDIFIKVADRVIIGPPSEASSPVFIAVKDEKVIDVDRAAIEQTVDGKRPIYPASSQVKKDIADLIGMMIGEGVDINTAFCRAEHRMAKAYEHLMAPRTPMPSAGLYIGEEYWSEDGFFWEDDFLRSGDVQAWTRASRVERYGWQSETRSSLTGILRALSNWQ